MFKERRVLVVIPARGGSKGVPLKNIYPLAGIPLIAHVGILINELPWVDKAIVSTDHADIAKVAQEVGIAAPFFRPKELSGDLVSDFDVLHHACREIERLDGVRYDVIIMLQPTSPLRRPIHVTAVVTKLIDENWDAVWTLTRTDLKYHPLKQLTLTEDERLEYFDQNGAAIIARQQLKSVYHRNGVAYAYTRECLLEQNTVKGKRTTGLVIDEPMISIDTIDDFKHVEGLLAKRNRQ